MRGRELETESVCWLKRPAPGGSLGAAPAGVASSASSTTDSLTARSWWREGRKREMCVFSLVMRETYKRAMGDKEQVGERGGEQERV